MRLNRGRIIRVVLAVVCLMVMTCPPVAADIYDHIYLADFSASVGWNTNMAGRYALGVSIDPGASLLPTDGLGRIALESGNVYYLYAGNLGTGLFVTGHYVQMVIYTDYIGQGGASPSLDVRFYVPAPPGPGAFNLWTYSDRITNGGLTPFDIYLGWAQGTADKVDLSSFSAGGGNDYYLVLGIGVPPTLPSGVPEPSTLLLLGSGLAGLVGYGRRRFKK